MRPRRQEEPELVDAAGHDAALLRENFADIARINGLPGGHRLTLRALARLLGPLPRGGALRLLDAGTGAADLPPLLVDWAERRGLRAAVVGIDASPELLALAPVHPAVELRVADVRSLPFDDGAFDAAVTSLVLHHLEPTGVVAALRELRRVSRRGVVANDLLRSWPAYAGAVLVTRALSANPLTRADGPASVLRAYTRAELRQLAAEAGLSGVEFVGFLGPRTAMTWRA